MAMPDKTVHIGNLRFGFSVICTFMSGSTLLTTGSGFLRSSLVIRGRMLEKKASFDTDVDICSKASWVLFMIFIR